MKLAAIAFMVSAIVAIIVVPVGAGNTAEIKVSLPASFKEPYNELVAAFEKSTGHNIVTTWSGTVETPKRIAAGEVFDLVIIWEPTINELIKQGKLVADSRTTLAKSGIGIAVRVGTPKIDISSGESIRKALLAAKSIGYATGPSGTYLLGLFQKWGIADQLESKLVQAQPGQPVGDLLERGDADVGFQQVSELVSMKGIDFLGPLPPDIQEISVLMAALHKAAPAPDAAKALVKFLTSPEAAPAIKKIGMEPG
jgi:molybdate transport system substrate-binding protein